MFYGKRMMSLVLAFMMVLSLSISVKAEEENVIDQTQDVTQVEETTEIAQEEETQKETTPQSNEKAENTFEAFSASKNTPGGMSVRIDAKEGLLPTGTSVIVRDVDKKTLLKKVNNVIDNPVDVNGVDISFYYEGKEIEPNGDVSVKLKSSKDIDGDVFHIVHIGDKTTEIIKGKVDEDDASFTSDSFSIYAIVGSEDGIARRTYNFYNGSKLLTTQIVKNGETLVTPDVQEEKGKVFLGWSSDNGETYQTTGKITDIGDKDETVDLYALFESSYYVTFHDASGSVLKTVSGKKGDKVNVDDMTFEVMSGKYVSGWTTNSEGTPDGEVKGNITINNKDIDLYPIVKDVHWVVFDENDDDGDKTSATFTKPFYVKDNEKVTKPSDPTRTGYVFDGWTTDKEGSNAYTFGQTLHKNIILYAKWKGDTAKYTVCVWVETLVDGQYVEGNYTLKDYYEKSAIANSVVDESEEVDEKFSKRDDFISYDFDHVDKGKVNGDGTTIINAYYKLHVFHVQFTLMDRAQHTDRQGVLWYRRFDTASNSWKTPGYYGDYMESIANISYEMDGKTYTAADDLTGDNYQFDARLGEDITKLWPQPSKVNYELKEGVTPDTEELRTLVCYGWIDGTYSLATPSARYVQTTSVYTMTRNFIRSDYKVGTSNDTQVVQARYAYNAEPFKMHYMFENPNDDGFSENKDYFQDLIAPNANWHGKEFTGFTLMFERSSDEEYNAPEGYPVSDLENQEFYFYYLRNRYPIFFYNYSEIEDKSYNSDDITSSNAKVKYEADIEDYYYEPERPKQLDDNYRFLGWYTTKDCIKGTEFDFTNAKMPSNSLALYAKWGVKEVNLSFESNGGSPIETQVLDYGTNGSEPSDPTRDGYEFGGWVNDKGELFHFKTKLYDDQILYARWLKGTLINIQYDASPGSGEPKDNNAYADISSAKILSAPSNIPENKYFYGWKLNDKVYKPNELLLVLSSDAKKITNNQYIITLTAVYRNKPKDTSLIYNSNTGKKQTFKYKNNETITIKENLFENDGYVFVGWNDQSDGSGKFYKEGDNYAVDNENLPNVLYAIWEKLEDEEDDDPSVDIIDDFPSKIDIDDEEPDVDVIEEPKEDDKVDTSDSTNLLGYSILLVCAFISIIYLKRNKKSDRM